MAWSERISLTRPRRTWLFLLLALVPAGTLRAQLSEIRGGVRDSAAGTPVPAAVVMLLDAGGATLLRTLTTERGQYRLLRPPEARQLRVVRLGFQPATVPLTQATGLPAGGYQLDVSLQPLARAMASVDVAATRGCPTRADRGAALTLLDEARAGLLASVVAREKDPPRLKVLRFERLLDGDGVETVSQTVRVDSSAAAGTSFAAVQSAADFLANGFRSGRDGDYTYFGPDAGVLLDERFQNGYCFSVAAPDSTRPTAVGLRFTPASRRSGRVDIDGTMWIDTAARALREITFAYVGIESIAEGLGAGGRIGLRTLPNGVPFIDAWQLRLVGGATRPGSASVGGGFVVREIGGELAEARWPDGRTWSAALATAYLTAVGAGNQPAPGAVLRLAGTEYRAVANADGRASIPNLLPGPYTVEVEDPVLRPLGLTIPTERTFTARRGSANVVRVEVGGPIAIGQRLCRRTDIPRRDDSWLLGRAVDADGKPLADVKWQLLEADDGRWKPRTDVATTDPDGLLALCRGLDRERTIELVAWRPRTADTVRVRRVLDAPLVALALRFPVARVATRSGPPVTVAGTVTDSASGAPIADARVHVVGTRLEGATDERGQFVIGGVATGRQQLEVGTPALDPMGLVSRRTVEVRDGMPPLALHPPSLPEALVEACRPLGGNGASLIVGRLTHPAGNLAALAGYRVVVEWPADSAGAPPERAGGWRRAVPDPESGTFRLCDVPTGRPLTLQAEADSMPAGAAPARTVTLSPSSPLARVDLRLDSTLVLPPLLRGTVIDDRTGSAIPDADVTLANLGRTARTDARGAFRFAPLPAGPHLLTVRAAGYQPVTLPVVVGHNRAVDQRVPLVPGRTR